ncbi:substrate-binding domain-containing protein [Streptacidiphilus fuscans]|uniref:DeoR/GlpR family transcriptional regulator n=1 Tax=Streptacidiphilus fuscans TaxID=2789292 RepID=A0A931FFE6_9ACTN|nr:substrate-binding domain-containing protein [Streptacidiphilus fuscans]MBF9072782.1 DeoR/GlpR family transcriptional regulator [Streptacidiphilus fuscans]
MGGKVERRHQRIVELVHERGSLRVTELAEVLGVSCETARRDVSALAAVGRVRRVHGSVSLPQAPPNARDARLLRQLRPPLTFGMVVPTAGYFYQSVVRSARRTARAAGARLIVAVSEYRSALDASQMGDLLAGGVDGLLLTPTWADEEVSEADCTPIADAHVPVVLVEREIPLGLPGAGLDRIGSDHAAGGALAVRHLAGLGHQRIALFGGPTVTMPHLRPGYHVAMRARGLVPIDLTRHGVSAADATETETETERLFDLIRCGDVTAVIVHNDTEALTVQDRLLERGLRIPHDLAMISYDDEVARLADVPITSVAPAKAELGKGAVELLLRRIADPDAHVVQTRVLPRLRIRASCGGVRAAH